MILLGLALVTFLVGASVTRFVTRDSAMGNFRDRWETHFMYRTDRVLAEVMSRFPVRDVAIAGFVETLRLNNRPKRQDELTVTDVRYALLHEIGDRAAEERPAPLWLLGARRAARRPYSAYSERLVRLRAWGDLVVCPWCLSFWVYLGLGAGVAATTASWTYGWAAPVLGGWYWAVLPTAVLAWALAARWVYALIATSWDSGES